MYSSGRVIRTHGAEAQPQVLRWFFVGWAASLRFLSGGAKVKIHDESNVSLIADFFDMRGYRAGRSPRVPVAGESDRLTARGASRRTCRSAPTSRGQR